MEKISQHKKIINMCMDGEWHCQNEFRALMIFSPHKRRCEIEGRKNRNEPITGKYYFDERKCEHGIIGQKDYKMFENRPQNLYKPEAIWRPEIIQERKNVKLF